MRVSGALYRFRFPVQLAIYVLGFWAPWERYGLVSAGGSTVWTALPSIFFRERWMGFSAAAQFLLVLGTILAVLAALIRIWSDGYLGGRRIDVQGAAGGGLVRADGPYRRVQHPLQLGLICHVLAIGLLMPPTGALLALLLTGTLQIYVATVEDGLRREQLGPLFIAYEQRVPRWLPALQTRVAALGSRQNWFWGALSQAMYFGTAIGFLAEGASYNGTSILRWVLIGLGIQLIWEALKVRPSTQMDRSSLS